MKKSLFVFGLMVAMLATASLGFAEEPPNHSVPDAGSTLWLMGGAIAALGVIRHRFAKSKNGDR